MSEKKQCSALTKAGTQCKNKAQADSDYCGIHRRVMAETIPAAAPTDQTTTAASPPPPSAEDVARFKSLVNELNMVADKLRSVTPQYSPPPFSPQDMVRLIRENMHHFTPKMRVEIVRELQESLQGSSPQDFLDPDTWKGMWYILNYSLQNESRTLLGNMSKRLSTLPGAKQIAALPGASTMLEIGDMLEGSSPKDFLDIDTWKGIWYIVNYSLQYEAGEVKRRLLGEEEE